MPRIVTVPLRPRGQKQNWAVWPQVQERGGCQGHFENCRTLTQSLFLFSFLPDCWKSCFTGPKPKPSFVSLWAPCLPQVSKKMCFLILKCFRTNSANGSCWFQCPAHLLLSFHNAKTTQNCRANTSWVQPAEKEAEILMVHLYSALVPSSSPWPSSWFQILPKFQPWPSSICHCGWSCFHWERHPVGRHGADGLRGI